MCYEDISTEIPIASIYVDKANNVIYIGVEGQNSASRSVKDLKFIC